MQRWQDHNLILEVTRLLKATEVRVNSSPLVLGALGVKKGCMGKASFPAAWSPPLGVATGSQQLSLRFCCPYVLTQVWPWLDTTFAHQVTPPAKAARVSFQLCFWFSSAFVPSEKILNEGPMIVASRSRCLTSFCHKRTPLVVRPESLSRPGRTRLNWGTQPGETYPWSTLCPCPRRTRHQVASGSNSPTSRSVDRLQWSPEGHFWGSGGIVQSTRGSRSRWRWGSRGGCCGQRRRSEAGLGNGSEGCSRGHTPPPARPRHPSQGAACMETPSRQSARLWIVWLVLHVASVGVNELKICSFKYYLLLLKSVLTSFKPVDCSVIYMKIKKWARVKRKKFNIKKKKKKR